MLTPNTPCLIMLMQQLYIEYNFTFSIFQLRYWTFVLTMLLRIMYFEEDQVDCRRPIYAWSLFLQLEKSLHFCNQVFEVHLYKDWQVYLCSSLLPRLLAHTQSNGAPLPPCAKSSVAKFQLEVLQPNARSSVAQICNLAFYKNPLSPANLSIFVQPPVIPSILHHIKVWQYKV